jgi:hypothetical protein
LIALASDDPHALQRIVKGKGNKVAAPPVYPVGP